MQKQVCGSCRESSWAGRTGVALLLLALTLAGSLSAQPALKVHEETIRIKGPIAGLQLELRHAYVTATTVSHRPAVLMLHGAGVPVSGNPDFPLGGRSMMTALAERGLDVWALDYYGFGDSDRYPEMQDTPQAHPLLGKAEDCARSGGFGHRFPEARSQN